MLVLIIIMAVISSVAVPAYSRFYAHAKFLQSVQQVSSLLTWARDAAMQSEGESTVRFDPQTAAFTVTVETPDTSGDQPAAVQDSTEPPALQSESHATTLGENVTVADFSVLDPLAGSNQTTSARTQGPELRFHEDGSADAARLVLASAEGYHALLEVVPTTGRVVVTDANELQ
jgi:Tfp pilus assembly protein FimT